MSDDIIKGESLYNTDDVFPESISNTPWRGVFEGLRGGLNDLFSRADDSFFARSFALFYRVFDIVFRDTPIIENHDVLDGLAKAYCIPAWNVEGDPVKGLYVLMAWLRYFPTKDKFYNLLVESGLNVDNIVIQRQEYSAGNTRLYYWVYVDRLRDSFFFKDSWLGVQVAFRSFLPFDISLQVNEVTPPEEATKLYFASDKSNVDIPANLNWPGDALYDENGAEYHPENSLEKVEVISVFEKDENTHPLRIAQQFENELRFRYDEDDNTINYAHLYNTTFQAANVYLLEYENPPAEFSYFFLSETGDPIDVDKSGTYVLYDENGTPVSTEDYPADALEQGGVRSYGKNIRCYGVFFDTEQHILTIEFHEAEDLKHVDRVYYRVAPPTPSYEEITVYADVSTTKYCQNNITNNTTATVNSSNTVVLYTDEERTKPFKFDYSNEYEIGYYTSGGEWISRSVQTINDMPATTANPGAGETVTRAYLLLDTGELWFVCNNSNTSYGYTNQSVGFWGSAKLRIRKKDQQYYAGYFYINNALGNESFSFGSSKDLYGAPATGHNAIALRSDFGTYLKKEIVGFYNSAGVLVSSGYTNFGWMTDYYNPALRVRYGNRNDGTLSIRMMLYTLSQPTYTGWLSTSHLSLSTNSGQNYVFYDEDGEKVMGDSQYLYIPIGIFSANGGSVGTTQAIINACSMGVSNTNYLYFTQSTGSSKYIARIWYIKVPNS